jgi:hypothetical protein
MQHFYRTKQITEAFIGVRFFLETLLTSNNFKKILFKISDKAPEKFE